MRQVKCDKCGATQDTSEAFEQGSDHHFILKYRRVPHLVVLDFCPECTKEMFPKSTMEMSKEEVKSQATRLLSIFNDIIDERIEEHLLK